jgi:negative regulator of sigma E activity
MRKLLALFGAVGLVSMSAATVVSCNDVADLGYYADSIENNLRTENYVAVQKVTAKESIIMIDYFNESGWFMLKVNPIDKDGKLIDQLKFDEFKGAIEMAINSVVSGSAKETDYTYSIKSADSAQDTTVDLTTLNYNN